MTVTTSSDLDIRRIGDTKMPGLASLYRFLHPQDPAMAVVTARETLRQTRSSPGSAVFVGYRGETPVATCALVIVASGARSGRPSALIENLVTHPEERLKGHGARLLRTALEAAWEAGCFKATVLTTSLDDAPPAFFAKAGFTRTTSGFEARRA